MSGSGGASGGAGMSGSGGASAGSGGGGGSRPAQTCAAPAAMDQPSMMLSQTGCVDPRDPTKLAVSVLPYEVNSPLWSDGADKQRGMALPADAKSTSRAVRRPRASARRGPPTTASG